MADSRRRNPKSTAGATDTGIMRRIVCLRQLSTVHLRPHHGHHPATSRTAISTAPTPAPMSA
ncbi:MAG TPA: hypothetical protein VNL12_16625, partial [Iamia sp.]|nr:hypothetical protein [Iamia sp.]